MTKSKKTNKVSMDDIFVVSADKVTPTGKFVNSTTAFKDLTTGRLAILAWDFDSSVRSLGDYKQSGDDSNEVQAIKVIVGTPVSNQTEFADIWGVGHAAYQESGVINKTNIRSVAVKQARFATNGIDCGAFYFTPEDNVEYKAYVRLKSVRNDRFYGDNDEVVHAIVPATDFTALSLTNDLDYILQKLAYEFNSQSKAVTLTGNAATLKQAHSLVCSAGSYSYTGNAATFKTAHSLVCSAGSYSLSGNASSLTYVPGAGAVNYTLTCAAGSYSLSGNTASLKVNRTFACATGVYNLSGVAATLTYLSGGSGGTGVNYGLACDTGVYRYSADYIDAGYVEDGYIGGIKLVKMVQYDTRLKMWDGESWVVTTLKSWDGNQWL